MKKVFIALGLTSILFAHNSRAASLQEVWSQDALPITKFAIDNNQLQATKTASRLYMGAQNSSAPDQLRLVNATVDAKNTSHARYNQYYQGIPVWGMQVIYHTGSANKAQKAPIVTGTLLRDVQKDVKTMQPKFSSADIAKHAQQLFRQTEPSSGPAKMLSTSLVIYGHKINNNTVAKLAYTVTFYVKTQTKHMKPFYIIDANNKQVLAYWDDLQRSEIGEGPGGNDNGYTVRGNHFQYGNALTGLPSLGKLDVTLAGNNCLTSNAYLKLSNFGAVTIPDIETFFPIKVNDEATYPAFSYTCNQTSNYINDSDGGYAPVNGGYSPVNDSYYFAMQTYRMLQDYYHINQPFGADIPIRINTHVDAGNLDNAFAMQAEYDAQGQLISHQQIVIGNGQTNNHPLTQGTLGHELAHLFTGLHSQLIYTNQSGGMNEAFSDISDLAMRSYIHSQFSWFNYDYNIGSEESKTAHPLRCMDNPTCDGNSIANANDYIDGMDVHYSSGVYNRAFYLLSTTPGWTIEKAYAVMLDANRFYWTPDSTFNSGCLGVAQAAYDKGYAATDVVTAFRNVGVSCKF